MVLVDRSMLVQAAAAAAGGQPVSAPALYIVATPIGNLADSAFVPCTCSATVDAIAC
jgi:16S rRNA (cytidine1402-2'-O)-methyltransferase